MQVPAGSKVTEQPSDVTLFSSIHPTTRKRWRRQWPKISITGRPSWTKFFMRRTNLPISWKWSNRRPMSGGYTSCWVCNLTVVHAPSAAPPVVDHLILTVGNQLGIRPILLFNKSGSRFLSFFSARISIIVYIAFVSEMPMSPLWHGVVACGCWSWARLPAIWQFEVEAMHLNLLSLHAESCTSTPKAPSLNFASRHILNIHCPQNLMHQWIL